MEKLFIYDLETTGTRFWKNGIHQLSGMIRIDGEVKEKFNFKVRPYERALIEPEALAIAKVTKEQIMSYDPMAKVKAELTDIIDLYVSKYDRADKFHLMGYNNRGFDDPFLRAFWTQCNDKYFGSYFWSDSIDVMVLASNALKDHRATMQNFKLETVAKTLGIDFSSEEAHDALYDVEKTYEIYQKLSHG